MCSMMKRTIEIREEGVPEELLVVRKSWEEGGVRFLSWSFRAERETVFPPVRVHIAVPARGIHYRWTPKLHLIKALNSDWFENLYETSGFTGAPVECLIAQDNKNCAVIALSDTLHTIGLKSIPVEETAQYDVEIALFEREAYRGLEYSVTVRVDTRPLPYYEALADTAKWWETIPGNEPAVVPEAAREIMYSTWYSTTRTWMKRRCSPRRSWRRNSDAAAFSWMTDGRRRIPDAVMHTAETGNRPPPNFPIWLDL